MTTTIPSHLVAPPGAILEEWLDEHGMSQRELADRLGKSEKFVSQLINAKATLTADTAHDLELVSRVDAATWLRMEADYRSMLRREAAVVAADAESSPFEDALVRALSRAGIVEAPVGAGGETTIEIYRLLGVASRSGMERLTVRHNAAFRISGSFTTDPVATEVVIAVARTKAAQIETGAIDIVALRAYVTELQSTTREESGTAGVAGATAVLAPLGVALVLLPKIPKFHGNALTLWDEDRAIVALTDRGQQSTSFLSTVTRSLTHLLDERRDTIYLHGGPRASDDSPQAEYDPTGS